MHVFLQINNYHPVAKSRPTVEPKISLSDILLRVLLRDFFVVVSLCFVFEVCMCSTSCSA